MPAETASPGRLTVGQQHQQLPKQTSQDVLVASASHACCRCACVCVQLQRVAYDDTAIWRRLCEQQFGAVTSPPKWLQAATTAAAAAADAVSGQADGHISYYR
jgi:CelD/BcsL family acetyltransferase involved in cellulose biosynthesis